MAIIMVVDTSQNKGDFEAVFKIRYNITDDSSRGGGWMGYIKEEEEMSGAAIPSFKPEKAVLSIECSC